MPTLEETLNELLEEALRHARARVAQRQWDAEHTYAVYLIEVLKMYPRGLRTHLVYPLIAKLFERDGKTPPPEFEATIRSAYNGHCENSSVFAASGKPISEAIFRSKTRGVWGLVVERAEPWINTKLAVQQGSS